MRPMHNKYNVFSSREYLSSLLTNKLRVKFLADQGYDDQQLLE
jgi:hypothetical protein